MELGFCVFLGFVFLLFWPHHQACGILVPGQGIETVPLYSRSTDSNSWTASKVLSWVFLSKSVPIIINPGHMNYWSSKNLFTGIICKRNSVTMHEQCMP